MMSPTNKKVSTVKDYVLKKEDCFKFCYLICNNCILVAYFALFPVSFVSMTNQISQF